MGCCLSKNDPCSQSIPSLSQTQQNDSKKIQNLSAPVKVEHTKKQVAAIATNPKEENKSDEKEEEEEEGGGGSQVYYPKKKEVFVIQHRKSNDKRSGGPDSDGSASNSSNSGDPNRETEEVGRNIMVAAANGQAVRTSSCTKEEVDAILIQCGRLSRSSSGKGNGNIGVGNGNGNGNGNGGHGRRYSGSKRSFDFDRENEIADDSRRKERGKENGNEGLVEVDDDERSRRRQSRGSHRRRNTPSRSRERERELQQQQQRSGSRERSQSNGRRVSRSPNRRSESPMNGSSSGSGNGNGHGKPGKLVSVPATVSSLSMEKTNNGNGGDGANGNGNVKRVLVKRNAGSPRSHSPARAHSPVRAHSPARGGNQGNGNGNGGTQQPASLSRNGSRRAEHSPYRRTPLNEIDVNSLPFHPLSNKNAVHKGKEIEEDVVVVKQPIMSGSQQNKYTETNNNGKTYAQGTHRRTNSRGAEGYEVTKTNYCRVNELQTPHVDQMPGDKRQQLDATEYDAMLTPVVFSGTDTLKLPQTLMRSRSARRSRDLDINVEAPTVPTSTPTSTSTPTPATNYNSILLQDIQNFHQKKNATANASANANASNSNNNAAVSSNSDAANTPFTVPSCISKANSILEAVADLNSTTASNLSSLPYADERRKAQKENNLSHQNGNKRADSKDPFVESEVKVGDDLMEPSMHKYVTVRTKGGDFNDEESSGSNSFVGGNANQQNWVSSSSWEPTSADSTDCWTSHSYSREDLSPVAFQRHAVSDFASGINEESERKLGKGGAPRARTMAGKGPISSTPKTAAASM